MSLLSTRTRIEILRNGLTEPEVCSVTLNHCVVIVRLCDTIEKLHNDNDTIVDRIGPSFTILMAIGNSPLAFGTGFNWKPR